ncbi:hypothetical protein N9J72_00660 [Candidatus Gracilibacteria bacterium]|nr:hypothetical protein [Candidatus Gracilibacteria bacterium]
MNKIESILGECSHLLSKTQNLTSNIRNQVDLIIKGGIKNRVSLATYGYSAFIAGGVYSFQTMPLKIFALVAGGFTIYRFLYSTRLGINTEQVYRRTKLHISRFGSVDERFFKKVLGEYAEEYAIGYCELQGIYLAMKERELEKEFFEMKKKFTNNRLSNF